MKVNEKLVDETIEEINIYLPKMIRGIEEFIECAVQLREQDAKKYLSGILEGLEWIVQAVHLTNKYKPGIMDEKELMEKLPEFLDACENNDYTLMSDILDYEIKPVLEKWTSQVH